MAKPGRARVRSSRKEAAVRRERTHDERTPREQIRLIRDERGITGGKEFNRLVWLIDNGRGDVPFRQIPKKDKERARIETRARRR